MKMFDILTLGFLLLYFFNDNLQWINIFGLQTKEEIEKLIS